MTTFDLSPTEALTPSSPTEAKTLAKMLERLNRLSLTRRSDAYLDIPWDEEGYELWQPELLAEPIAYDPICKTSWYRSLSMNDRARYGCYRVASAMKVGIQFENVLQQGLLRMATTMENGASSFRYVHHEVIEESQHSLMFQELVNRSGLPVEGMTRFWRTVGPPLSHSSIRFDPAFFLLYVLGGEEPVDHLQRTWLRAGVPHPLVEKIIRIHVTEEARHISFANHYLRAEVPKMGWVKRQALALHAPVVLAFMVPIMLEPAPDLCRYMGLHRSVVAEAFATKEGRALKAAAAVRIQRLWEELGLMTAASIPIWKAAGLWTEPEADDEGSP